MRGRKGRDHPSSGLRLIISHLYMGKSLAVPCSCLVATIGGTVDCQEMQQGIVVCGGREGGEHMMLRPIHEMSQMREYIYETE